MTVTETTHTYRYSSHKDANSPPLGSPRLTANQTNSGKLPRICFFFLFFFFLKRWQPGRECRPDCESQQQTIECETNTTITALLVSGTSGWKREQTRTPVYPTTIWCLTAPFTVWADWRTGSTEESQACQPQGDAAERRACTVSRLTISRFCSHFNLLKVPAHRPAV